MLIAAPSGTGKSHIAHALGHCAVRRGYDVLLTTQSQLLGQIHAALSRLGKHLYLPPYIAYAYLVLLDKTYDLGSQVSGLNLKFYKSSSPSHFKAWRGTLVKLPCTSLASLQQVLNKLKTGVKAFEGNGLLYCPDINQGGELVHTIKSH